MQIGEVIRKYRKGKRMTQEEMAKRLGVTAPAVNKWENGNSLPDIMLLAPIARLLDISLDTLLSYRESLTDEEIEDLIAEADARLKNETYEEAFQWAKKKMETYPNCDVLLLRLAQVLDAARTVKEIPEAVDYDGYIAECYVRVLDSGDEEIRSAAADCLFHFYIRKEQYEKAEEYLVYFSKQNPERKRKQAFIYSRTERVQEAYRLYEELLFSGCQMLRLVFGGLYLLAMQEKDWKKAHLFIEKDGQLAKVFDLGKYQEISCRLELAAAEKDIDGTIAVMERMLENVGEMCAFYQSPLYEHMGFKPLSEEFPAEMKKNLLEAFRDEEAFGFLKEDKRWKNLVG